jgi:hypothetical protein
MLVLLKIPLVYLCMVVWWAIRAEPRDEQPTVGVRVSDTPPSAPVWTRSQKPGRRPGPDRTPRGRIAPHPASRGEARR